MIYLFYKCILLHFLVKACIHVLIYLIKCVYLALLNTKSDFCSVLQIHVKCDLD